jgi:hypothetical protein
MYENLFGNDDGANDPLLFDCFVAPGPVEHMPIVVGRWGAGKTSILIHRNDRLANALRVSAPNNPDADRLWYLPESSTDHHVIHQIRKLYSDDPHGLKKAFEMLWRSEILNCAAKTLNTLYNFYGSPDGEHWTELVRISERGEFGSIWTTVSSILRVALPDSRHSALEDFLSELREKNVEALTNAVQACLADIEEFDVQPAVCIEPIETPNSDIEQEENIAQTLVNCLLNTYFDYFRPIRGRQRLRVEIAIPWHRYRKQELMQPQKFLSYIGDFNWRKSALRKFINKRIEYEFRRVGRKLPKKGGPDAWRLLFPESLRNGNSRIVGKEDTFEYVLRHSQYRTRDIILLCRRCVVLASNETERTVDDILRGRVDIDEDFIIRAVRQISSSLAIDREIEASRRMPDVHLYIDALKGMPIPFSLDDLKRRVKRFHGHSVSDDVGTILQKLWDGGFVGLRLSTTSIAARNQLRAQFGKHAQSPSDRNGLEANFYLFEHITRESPYDILNTHDGQNGRADNFDIEVEIVTHPMMFERLANRVNLKTPIGV